MAKYCRRKIYSGRVLECVSRPVSARVKIGKADLEKPPRHDIDRVGHLMGISKRRMTRTINSNFSNDAYFVTLTFDNEHYDDTYATAYAIFRKFCRKLKRINPDYKAVWVYGRGRKNKRIHIHMIISGVAVEKIMSKWTWGDIVDVEPLSEWNYDHVTGECYGRDYRALAAYMFRHWTSEQEGTQYYHVTRNLESPFMDEPEEIDDDAYNSKPDVPPDYVLVDYYCNTYGCKIHRYVFMPPDYSDEPPLPFLPPLPGGLAPLDSK